MSENPCKDGTCVHLTAEEHKAARRLERSHATDLLGALEQLTEDSTPEA